MFAWWRERQREKLLEQPFPEEWDAIIDRNVGYARFLPDEQRALLRDLVQVFVDEKNFEGCGGLTLTDEIRITIAAGACILLLGLDHDLYRRVDSVLIYPSTVRPPEREPGVFVSGGGGIVHEGRALLGEAHMRGPVILVWDAVKRGARHPKSGHNVVFHEFAHKLDMLDGSVDGTPPLRDSAQLERWAEVCSAAYAQLQQETEQGRASFMDDYGATSEAEFFAVATETFFERPHRLHREQPELYAVLRDYYAQDPRGFVPE